MKARWTILSLLNFSVHIELFKELVQQGNTSSYKRKIIPNFQHQCQKNNIRGGGKKKETRSGIITGLLYSKTAHLTLQFILPLLFQTKKADRLGHDSQLQRQTLPRILQGKK